VNVHVYRMIGGNYNLSVFVLRRRWHAPRSTNMPETKCILANFSCCLQWSSL